MHEYPNITINLTLFNCTITNGVPQLLEHNDLKWIAPAEISQYDFCPADTEILKLIKEKTIMNEVFEFLKACKTYYIATVDGDQPRVRPFGTVDIFEGKLYIQTGRKKDVSKQMHKNPKIEICAFMDGKWLRVAATAVSDDNIEAEKHLLSAYSELSGMYKPGDGNNEVYYLKDATATFSSFTDTPKVVKF